MICKYIHYIFFYVFFLANKLEKLQSHSSPDVSTTEMCRHRVFVGLDQCSRSRWEVQGRTGRWEKEAVDGPLVGIKEKWEVDEWAGGGGGWGVGGPVWF